MHLDIYESISFKVGMVIDADEVFILILVWGTVAFIQGHRGANKQIFFSAILQSPQLI